MKIFISHKMPADTPAVKEFGDRLALYAGSAIEISHAGKFDKGADFRNLIEQEILSSDIFILYYTSDSYDWSFCITSTTKDYEAVAKTLYALGLENAKYYRNSATAYAAEAQSLSDVSTPPAPAPK
ncbi:hypothetical protein ACVINW_007268 [Bradyrhizobium sp. USDA 4461]